MVEAWGQRKQGICLWVELIALGLSSVDYFSYVDCEMLHKSWDLPCGHLKGSDCGFLLSLKKNSENSLYSSSICLKLNRT